VTLGLVARIETAKHPFFANSLAMKPVSEHSYRLTEAPDAAAETGVL
jgi:hypothetical protein